MDVVLGPWLRLEAFWHESRVRAIAEGDVAGRPRLVVGLGGIIVSDLIVRPAGNLVMIFGMRETGESMNQRSRMGLLGRLLDSF